MRSIGTIDSNISSEIIGFALPFVQSDNDENNFIAAADEDDEERVISVWLSVTVRLQFEDNISRKLEGLRTLHQTTSFAQCTPQCTTSFAHSAQMCTAFYTSPLVTLCTGSPLVCTELHCMEVNLSELAAASGMDESIGLWCW